MVNKMRMLEMKVIRKNVRAPNEKIDSIFLYLIVNYQLIISYSTSS